MADREVTEQIRALEERRYQAMTSGDVEELELLCADDLSYTHSDASRDTKTSYLDKVSAGFFNYGPISHPERSIVVAGDCAVVTGDMKADVTVQGQARVLNNSALAVWVRKEAGWQLIAYQPTPYPPGR